MARNWELEGWPDFAWQPDLLRVRDQVFIENAPCVIWKKMTARKL